MNKLVKIENTVNIEGNDLQVVAYKGVRVLSSYDIARLHSKEVAQVNRQFERNKERFKEGVDYFLINKGEFSESLSGIQVFIPNNVKDIKLFTERGYLKLVKCFTDELSWNIQDALVEHYFTVAFPQTKIEAVRAYLEELEAHEVTRVGGQASLTHKKEVAKLENGKSIYGSSIRQVALKTGRNYSAKKLTRWCKANCRPPLVVRQDNPNGYSSAKVSVYHAEAWREVGLPAQVHLFLYFEEDELHWSAEEASLEHH